ncbi:MAG TPA: hypothetical protein VGC69_11345 [Bordetella sp.]
MSTEKTVEKAEALAGKGANAAEDAMDTVASKANTMSDYASLKRFASLGAIVVLASLGSGCSSVVGECGWLRSSCMYDGHYEPGEKDYAEQKAQQLNKEEAQKIKSGF